MHFNSEGVSVRGVIIMRGLTVLSRWVDSQGQWLIHVGKEWIYSNQMIGF